jgi:hypothetical protein
VIVAQPDGGWSWRDTGSVPAATGGPGLVAERIGGHHRCLPNARRP